MDLTDLLSPFTSGLTQAQRLLRLHTPLGADALFAEDIEVWEGIGPVSGPALGDVTPDTRSPWPFDASFGPTR